jgi:hypothetical protein
VNSLRLALRVLRVDRRTRTSAILTAAGVAVATGLVLLLVALPGATQARAQRALWQEPSFADSGTQSAALLMATTTDHTGGQEITRIDVAVEHPSTVELPPGVPKLPGPGEVLVSPALGKRIHALPASQLADRFGGKLTGVLTPEALRFPEQLVAVVGHAPADMPPNAHQLAGFPQGHAQVDPMLTLLAGVGVVVLLVPSLVLVASTARLTAARRERRLASLRLAGATPGQVTGMVAAETALSAAGGAVAGLAVGAALKGLATFVPWAGGTWQATDFILSPALTVAVVVAIPVLVVLAGILGLRRVVTAPIGAAAGHARKPPHWWRLLALPVAGLFFWYALSTTREVGGPGVVLLGLALVVASAAIVGPWLTSGVGGTFVRGWRRPAGLLAGRRLRDDPKGAYRASAGVVLAVFTGSMALTLLPSFEAMAGGGPSLRDDVLYVDTNAGHADAIVAKANAELARYGQAARATRIGEVLLNRAGGGGTEALVLDCADAARLTRFDLTGACTGTPSVYSTYPADLRGVTVAGDTTAPGLPFAPGTPVRQIGTTDPDLTSTLLVDPGALPVGVAPQEVRVAVPTTPENREVVRTALTTAAPGVQVESRELRLDNQQTELADLRRVTVIGLVAAGILAGCSAAVATAGSVLDRRRTFGALIAAGTPVRVLARALRTEAALPALVATIGAGAVGVLVGLGLLGLVPGTPVVLSLWILAPVVLGVGVAVLAASVCTPALNRVRAEPLADE